MKKTYTYRITTTTTTGDINLKWTPVYRDALKLQRELYKNGAERVEINKEYLA